MPKYPGEKTELETASTPNMDSLSKTSICGFSLPAGYGITPGSAPGHLSLFGYDPMETYIGRGVLEALGVELNVEPGDVAARGNLCTVDDAGIITDRRAGRISTEENARRCRLLDGKTFDGIKVIVKPVKDHRLAVILRGEGLDSSVTDTDPQKTGVETLESKAHTGKAEATSRVINKFLHQARDILKGHEPANMLLLRGFSSLPTLPTMQEIYKLTPAAIAGYPMYRGLAKLAGMDILSTGPDISDEINTLRQSYRDYDFFFLHIKGADSAGEDGDFNRKVAVIEEVDRFIPEILKLEPDVFIVAGDHSTPAALKSHSWHPVPLMLYSKYCRPDNVATFSESACTLGALGTIPATGIMPLAMANAFKLNKYGA